LRTVSLILLAPVMMWLNLSKNVTNWVSGNHVPGEVLGIASTGWFLAIGVVLATASMVAIIRQHQGTLAMSAGSDFGRAQLLFLAILWVFTIGASMQALPAMSNRGTFLVQASFRITSGICFVLVLALTGRPTNESAESRPAAVDSWRLGPRFWAQFCLVPLVLLVIAWMTTASHREPLPGSHLRFDTASAPTSP